jgi:hypothetical protein
MSVSQTLELEFPLMRYDITIPAVRGAGRDRRLADRQFDPTLLDNRAFIERDS